MDQFKTTASPPTDFFVAGGTLPLHSESYIERAADRQIIESLQAARFCYVLNSRQMGKSSLCVRTMARLSEKGIQCAFIDITKLGGRNVTPEQWYAGMALEIGRSTGLRKEILEYWKAEENIGPMQRFFGAIRQVVLGSSLDRFVIFVDEIDSTRSLPFNTDEFFSGVRECFNRRVQEPEFERLTFCFLGVAVPSDLIQDARTTPFNIGDRIYLRDFTLDEVSKLAEHLGPHGEAVLKRVHYWTNGHPFLTQSLCRALMQIPEPTVTDVNEIVKRDLFEPKVRETNINLSDVGNRVLNGYADGDDVEEFRANILSAYQKALTGKEQLFDDESNRITAVLKLSGLMRSDGGQLFVRNRIYQFVFGKEWIVENMPGQEMRRQRRAFVRGVVRTTLIAACIVSLFAYLTLSNISLRKKAELAAADSQKKAREMAWQSYVSDMNRLPVLFEQNNTKLMEELLARHEKADWRGAEWDYWDGRINEVLWKGPRARGEASYEIFPDEKRLIWIDENKASILDSRTGEVLKRFNLPPLSLAVSTIMWDGRHLVRRELNSPRGYVYDLILRKVTWTFSDDSVSLIAWQNAFSKDGRYGYGESRQVAGIIDIKSRKLVHKWPVSSSSFVVGFLSDNETVVYGELDRGVQYKIIYYNLRVNQVTRVLSGLENVWTAAGATDAWITINHTDGWVKRYRVSDGKLLWKVRPTTERLWISSESKDGSIVTVTTRAKVTYVYKVAENRARLIYKIHSADWARITPTGFQLYTLDHRLAAHSLVKPSGFLKTTLPKFLGDLAYIKKNDQIVAVNSDGATSRIQTQNGRFTVVPASIRWAESIFWWQIDPVDGAIVALSPSELNALDPDTGQVVYTDRKNVQGSVSILGSGKAVRTTDHKKFEIIGQPSEAKAASFELAFLADYRVIQESADARFLAVGGSGGKLALVDCQTWKIKWEEKVHTSDLRSIAFSGSGKLIATASEDDTAAVIDIVSGRVLTRFQGHAQSVISVDFLPGEQRIVTVSDDKNIKLWDVSTGAELTTVAVVGDSPSFVSVSADKKYILSATKSGTIYAWPLKSLHKVARGTE